VTSIQSAKLGMSPDAFLYACIQSDEARRKKDGSFNSHLRYEPFLFNTYRTPQKRTLEAFANDLHGILQHHWSANPQFRRGEFISMETISYFSQAVPTVIADIEDLVRLFFGRGLPVLVRPEEASEISDDFPALEEAVARFQKYNDTLVEDSGAYDVAEGVDDPALEAASFSTELWYVISELSKEIFGDYTGALLGFVNWKYAPKEAEEAIDWRITPPVGAAYIKWRKSLDPDFGKPPHLRRGDRDDKRDGKRGDKREGRGDKHEHRGDRDAGASAGVSAKHKPQPQEQAQGEAPKEISLEAPKPHREHHDKREHSEKRGEKFERGGGGKFEKRHSDHGNRRFRDEGSRQSSEEQVEAGIAEAKAAMETLKSDKSVHEVPLAPTNSFIRRAQHAFIVEMGFETESRGEGRDRAVYVMRAKG
jgi:hypothetical protein